MQGYHWLDTSHPNLLRMSFETVTLTQCSINGRKQFKKSPYGDFLKPFARKIWFKLSLTSINENE